MERNDRFIDELLDSALAQHAEPERRPGLEARILERVHADHNSRLSGRLVWSICGAAAAAAAIFALAVTIHVTHQTQKPSVQTSEAAKAAPAPTAIEALSASSEETQRPAAPTTVLEPEHEVRLEGKESSHTRRAHWPSQFPTPAPLTSEEKALIRYVQETPPKVLAAALRDVRRADQPIEIKPLEIQPLEIKPLAQATALEDMQ